MKEEFIKYRLNNMSLREKIGQMIMIDYRDVKEMNIELESILTKYNPGGFILFRSNIANYEQTRKLLDEIKKATNIKSMVAVDQEGGRVQRLDEKVGFKRYPSMSEIGKTIDEAAATLIGMKMGVELKEIGVDMDMAPILDIFSNPENQVIGDRAFGMDSATVTKMALAYADGLKKVKIMAVGKHFPGHGDTVKDSHIDLPIVEKELEQLRQLELIPFIEAVRKNLPGIMIGHIAVPKVTGDIVPASISKVIINDLLREDIGYDGLVIPDSLKMKALTKYFTNEDIYLRCVAAGNDMLLMPQDITHAYEIIYRSVNDGVIPEERIDKSVYRILKLKFEYGFFDREYREFLKYNAVRKKYR